MATENREPTADDHPNNAGVGHLYAAKAEFSKLAFEAGRSPQGRCYNIIVTDIEKLLAVEAFYFPAK